MNTRKSLPSGPNDQRRFFVTADSVWIPEAIIEIRNGEAVGWLIDRVAELSGTELPNKRRISRKKEARIRERLTDLGWLDNGGQPYMVAGIPPKHLQRGAI